MSRLKLLPGVLLAAGLIMTGRDMIQAFKNTPGTNFYGADLQAVDFSHAILNDCVFEFFYNKNYNFEIIQSINWYKVSFDGTVIEQKIDRNLS